MTQELTPDESWLSLQGGAPVRKRSVEIWPWLNSIGFMVDMTNWFHGFYKPTYNCGAPSCIPISDEFLLSHLAAGCFPGGKNFLTGFLDGVMNEVNI